MLAPIDKISNPRGNDIMQIVVTTRCDRNCSNCTQLLPFRVDYAFMSTECFEQACISVADWPGLVAMFGGNPCVHPKFPELCQIMAQHIAPEHRGLWTNNLMKHGEIAAQTFGKGKGRFNAGGLNLNAHTNTAAADEMNRWFPGRVIPQSIHTPAKHAALLVDYRDFGITEEQWPAKREACDYNRDWSGAIVGRDGGPYGYFCEIAAAMDGIRGENSGIPATPGWWKQRMPAFEAQVKNCCDRGCGGPLRDKGNIDIEETYRVSKSFLPLAVDRRNLGTKIEQVDQLNSKCARSTDYARATA